MAKLIWKKEKFYACVSKILNYGWNAIVYRRCFRTRKMLPHHKQDRLSRQRGYTDLPYVFQRGSRSLPLNYSPEIRANCFYSGSNEEGQEKKKLDFHSRSSSSLPPAPSPSSLLSMASFQANERSRNLQHIEDSNYVENSFPSSEGHVRQLEKMRHRNGMKKALFEKVSCERENGNSLLTVWSPSSPYVTPAIRPSCNSFRWGLLQSRDSTQLTNNRHPENVDNLIATGTIWIPSITGKGFKALQGPLSSIPVASTFKKIPSLHTKPICSVITSHSGTRSPYKEAEVSYQDPVTGAPTNFLHRLNEIAVLESETVRQERSRKLKKRNKHDRDSSSY